MSLREQPHPTPWRQRLFVIIFEHDTPAGKAFDVGLLIAIVLSVLAVMIESVPGISPTQHRMLVAAEWTFTVVFTIEYILRLLSVRRPVQYARSFFGIVDVLAVAPTYLALLLPGAQELLVIRALRLLRIFRVLKMGQYLSEAALLTNALHRARPKITVFVLTVLTLVVIVGALMHLIEGPERGFTSIPISVYWAIVTLTTVGYGDIAPQTPAGRILASIVMITGYGIIAVPTGIVMAELVRGETKPAGSAAPARCSGCGKADHRAGAIHCDQCGERLK